MLEFDPQGGIALSLEVPAAFAAAGWDARVAGDWPPEELAARIMGGGS
jgi:hypothetical protein